MKRLKRFEVEGTITVRFTQIVDAESKDDAMEVFEEGAFPTENTGFLEVSREAWSTEELSDESGTEE